MYFCGIEPESGLLVSDNGKVYKEVGQWIDKYGYLYVTHNRKNLPVHRLVAKAFVPGRTDDTPVVMHKDDNPKNNNPNNLEWGTYQQNNMDAVKHGLRSNVIPVRCMETGTVYQSARRAAIEVFGKPKRADHILHVCREQRGKCGGLHWEFV